MMLDRVDIIKACGAVLAILLQVVLAPNISLFGSFPCIPLVYVLTFAAVSPNSCGPLMPFAVGLVCDLLGSGPVGALAFLFMVASLCIARLFCVMNNDSLFMPLLSMFVALVVVESLYGILLIAIGLPVGYLEAFFTRAVPCALYDFAVALLVYPSMIRLFADSVVVSKNSMPHVKLR